ncbi:hypothetical protein KGY73_08800, partial [bacterium]|nr:hypothetical protein [bacterium]
GLKKYKEGDLKTIKQEHKRRAQEVEKLKKEINNLIGQYRSLHKEAAQAWSELKSPTKKSSHPKTKKEKTEKTTETKETKSGRSEKQKKILSLIQDNPGGITLAEMGYIMGVAFVSLTQDVKKLMDEGVIKKEENKYFIK